MKQLRYVLVLAEHGSFAKAADELDISQPSLSQYIKKIEKQVGIELFNRMEGEVRLTDAGQCFADTARKMLDLEHQMQNRFSDISAYKTGSVIIGTSPYRSASFMPQVAGKFQRLYPGIYLDVEEMTTAELLEKAVQGRFDLCLTLGPVNEKLFSYRKIADEELILAVPSSFQKLKATTMERRRYPVISAGDVNGCGFITITESQYMQKMFKGICAEHGIQISVAATVKSLEAQIAMVRNGVGMALVPSGIESFCSEKEVTFYSFEEDFPRREVVALWRKDRELNQVSKALLDVMVDMATEKELQ